MYQQQQREETKMITNTISATIAYESITGKILEETATFSNFKQMGEVIDSLYENVISITVA